MTARALFLLLAVLAVSPARGADLVLLPGSATLDGPHAAQAFGWAWKRRSAGFSYSARQSPHIAKPAIVVKGRS